MNIDSELTLSFIEGFIDIYYNKIEYNITLIIKILVIFSIIKALSSILLICSDLRPPLQQDRKDLKVKALQNHT